ncbi:hypothetical protein RB601_004661 [Gaeumannomyces tritici]
MMPPDSWQAVAARKQAQRSAKIPAEWRIPASIRPPADVALVQDFARDSAFFTEDELRITEATASEVVFRVARAEWTALQVTTAVCKRAAVAQQLLNCLTEVLFDDAVARAKELDAYFLQTGRTVGLLHGLPISLSDQFWLKGVDSTIGYVASADKPAAEDSTVVQLLRDAGAVFYAKSNVPTTLTSGETVNGLFGRTVNPRNRTLSPGGSSGGEAALVTFRASFLGVGTDIGGSVRHPCSFTGLYGLRPSHGRAPHRRVSTTYAAGQTDVLRPSVAPLCRSPDDVRLFMATLAALQPWRLDPLCLHLPWRVDQERLPPRLCFGLSYGDGVVAPTPPLRRALDMVRARLLAAGHGVIEHTAHEVREADEIIGRMAWTAEGNGGDEFPRRGADRPGELSMSSSSSSGAAAAAAAGLKGGGGWLGAGVGGGGGLAAPGTTQVVRAQTVSETWQNQQARSLLFRKWSDRWERTAARPGANGRVMDALIMPSTPFPAVRHDRGLPWHYGQLSPLLDLTTGVFPVTKVDLVKDVVPPDWRPISDKDLEIMKFYGRPENHENALVGLVLIGRRLEEEKVTAMLKVMEQVVGVDY